PMIEISDAMVVVQESAHEDADVIFGTSTDESLPENYVKITIIATGFEKDFSTGSNNENFVSETPSPVTKIRPRLVVGGDLDGNHLDIPSYMRQQQD
ncbi:MAG: cell division protein FtsZ, partial [Sulfurimonas sp.]|nr:cell division protein FtsZ [Sulfurimonas sp.]